MRFIPKSVSDRLNYDGVSLEENWFVSDKLLSYLTRDEEILLEKHFNRSSDKGSKDAVDGVFKKIKHQYKRYLRYGTLPRRRVAILVDVFPPIEGLKVEENIRVIDDLLCIIGFNREKNIRDYLKKKEFSIEEELMIREDIKRLREVYSGIPSDLEKIKLLYEALDLIEIQFRNNGYNKAGYDMYKARFLYVLGLESNSFLEILTNYKEIAYEEIKSKGRE